jgi:hypothetical protein
VFVNLGNTTPSIQEFKLLDIEVLVSYLPSNITPAFISFDISVFKVDNIEAHIRWYQYITKKYTNVTSTKYNDGGLNRYDSDIANRLYTTSILDFLQLIGLSSDAIHLANIPRNVNISRELNHVDARIKEFNLFKSEYTNLIYDLSCSNQSNYIEILYL